MRIEWQDPKQARERLRVLADATGAVDGCVVKMLSPTYDGGPELRQAWYDVSRDQFVCSMTAKTLGERPIGWALDGSRHAGSNA